MADKDNENEKPAKPEKAPKPEKGEGAPKAEKAPKGDKPPKEAKEAKGGGGGKGEKKEGKGGGKEKGGKKEAAETPVYKRTAPPRLKTFYEKEGSLHLSNISLWCEKCAAPRRSRAKLNDAGGKLRVCYKCGNEFPQQAM